MFDIFAWKRSYQPITVQRHEEPKQKPTCLICWTLNFRKGILEAWGSKCHKVAEPWLHRGSSEHFFRSCDFHLSFNSGIGEEQKAVPFIGRECEWCRHKTLGSLISCVQIAAKQIYWLLFNAVVWHLELSVLSPSRAQAPVWTTIPAWILHHITL